MGIAAGMKDIVQDIAASYHVRIAEVGRLKEEAKEMLTSFQASHKHMSAELRKGLAQHSQSLSGEVTEMRQEIRASHQDMGTKLKKDLAQGMAARESNVKSMLNDFQKSRKQMGAQLSNQLANYDRGIKSEVAGMRQEIGADLREARTAWRDLTATLQAKRVGIKGPLKGEAPDLEARLFTVINQHPEGITLAEVADSLGIAPIVLGRAVKSLVDRGEIRKEDKLYFPMSTE